MSQPASLPASAGLPGPLGHDELVQLEAPLRRFVLSRVSDPHRADDIVQETLLRTWEAASRLEIETLIAYAIVVARNEINAWARADATAQRHLPRLVDLREPGSPEDAVTAQESGAALTAALTALPERTRLALVAHDLHDEPLARIAERQQVRAGALATQLHRTRARLRVDYVLAMRRATLPTSRCRSVLMAISAGDTRQQRALDAGPHLADCPMCDQLAEPLLSRDRSLAGLLPWFALGAPHGAVEGWVRRHPRASATSAAAVGLAAAAVLIATLVGARSPAPASAVPAPAATVTATTPADPLPSPSATAPAPPSSAAAPTPAAPKAVPGLTTSGQSVVAAASQLGAAGSLPVTATGALVVAVPGDEGFWVGDDQARMWVQMTGSGESPLHVIPGMRLSFQATMVTNGPAFVDDLTLKHAEDRDALNSAGVHLSVPNTGITVTR